MALTLKNHEKIYGIKIGENEILITQLADDTPMFLKDTNSLNYALSIIKHFEQCAGLKLNRDKKEGILLGVQNNADLKQFGRKTVKHTIKILEIIIDKDINNMNALNFKEKIVKVKNLLNM